MRSILFIFLVIFSNAAFSQNITFDQAQNLRKKSLADVETFLTTKGWSLTEAEEASADKLGKVTFGYNVDEFDSEKAIGWIIFYESEINNNYNRLSIQIHKPALYTSFMTRLTANGYKLESSKIIDGGIKKVYQNTTTTCVVTTATSEGTFTKGTTYNFFFIDNLFYFLIDKD